MNPTTANRLIKKDKNVIHASQYTGKVDFMQSWTKDSGINAFFMVMTMYNNHKQTTLDWELHIAR